MTDEHLDAVYPPWVMADLHAADARAQRLDDEWRAAWLDELTRLRGPAEPLVVRFRRGDERPPGVRGHSTDFVILDALDAPSATGCPKRRGRSTGSPPRSCPTARRRCPVSEPSLDSADLEGVTMTEVLDDPDRHAERVALPPAHHRPVFNALATPHSWVCAVCWGDGWSTGWPCAPAVVGGAELGSALGLEVIR